MPEIVTPRLQLVPMTMDIVLAVIARDRTRCEDLTHAEFPIEWPGDALIARAFPYSIDAIKEHPEVRLWGDTLVFAKYARPRLVGSVVFHGRPDDGIAEVGYGIDADSRGIGLATEATLPCVEWALAQPGISAVRATTFPWHLASLGVIRKLGMQQIANREHDTLGELLVFERKV